VRELAEEAGVTVAPEDLELMGEARFDHPQVRERCRMFRVTSAGPFTPADGEVVALELVPRAGLADWCAVHELVPDSVEVVLPLTGGAGAAVLCGFEAAMGRRIHTEGRGVARSGAGHTLRAGTRPEMVFPSSARVGCPRGSARGDTIGPVATGAPARVRRPGY